MLDTIKVTRDFHPFPAGRYVEDGEGNGTTFREKFLLPALRKHESIQVDLDGAPGYPSSFLEEAFGGLVREGIPPDMIRQHLKLKATDPGYQRYVKRIWDFIEMAAQQKTAG